MQKTYRQITHQLTILSICLAAFSINLPTKFMDLSLSLLFIFWVISGNFKNKIQRIKENPGALVALGFFVLMGLTIFYSSAPLKDSLKSWLRYHGLLFIPIIVSVIYKKKDSDSVINAFLISSVIATIGSYLKYFNLIPLNIGIDSIEAGSPVFFKFSIAHNIFLAYAVYLLFCKLLKSENIIRYSIL
jgi:O-antigen ligase